MMQTHPLAPISATFALLALAGCSGPAMPAENPIDDPLSAQAAPFDPWAHGDRVWVAIEDYDIGSYAMGDPTCAYGGLAAHPIIRLAAVPPGTDHLEFYVASWELSSGVRVGYDLGDRQIKALPDVREEAVWMNVEIPQGAFERNQTWGFYSIHVLPGTTDDCYDGYTLGDSTVEVYAVKGAGGCDHEETSDAFAGCSRAWDEGTRPTAASTATGTGTAKGTATTTAIATATDTAIATALVTATGTAGTAGAAAETATRTAKGTATRTATGALHGS